jgi:hypothetical protein
MNLFCLLFYSSISSVHFLGESAARQSAFWFYLTFKGAGAKCDHFKLEVRACDPRNDRDSPFGISNYFRLVNKYRVPLVISNYKGPKF